jgi:hypothetical protein
MLDVTDAPNPADNRDFFGRRSVPLKGYVLFPRSLLADLWGEMSAIFNLRLTKQGEIIADVVSGNGDKTFSDFYMLNGNLDFSRLLVGDQHLTRYTQLAASDPSNHRVSIGNDRKQLARVLRFRKAPNGNDPALEKLFVDAPLCGSGQMPCQEVIQAH